ncbi:MAG TPA: hypothetical protein VG756_12825 [Pseudonocardiaceae bacterium]|nr:hypothetical protein [Pseudonocardiaceae bacterium]
MDEDQALGRVGLANPGGDPRALGDSARGWQELSAFLQDQQDRLGTLFAQAPQRWDGAGSDAVRQRVRELAANAQQLSQVAADVGSHQQEHADKHAKVLEIVREVAIQIAVTLAFIALACIFPWLLAAAEAQLVALAVQGGRAVELLAQALSLLTRALSAARGWMTELGKLTWNTGRVSLGYGRFLADGARDFTIDQLANTTTSAIEHKKLDPAQLFTSAAVSFGVGGVVGSLETSGLKRLRNGSGDIARDAAGKPEFVSLGTQAKDLAGKLSGTPRAEPVTDPVRARAGELAAAQSRLADTRSGLWSAHTNHELARMSGDEGWRQDTARELAAADGEHTAAHAGHAAAAAALDDARATRAAAARKAAENRNTKRALGVGSPRDWPEYLIYDPVKDGIKGAISSAGTDGIGVADGRTNPHDIWKDVLLGAAGGSVRGAVNGKFANTAYAKDGLEEIAWKSGTKGLDKFLRGQIEDETDQPPDAPEAPEANA